MITKKENFDRFNIVINTIDYLLKYPEYSPFSQDVEKHLQHLKDRLLKYSIIHYSNEFEVRVSYYTEDELELFNILWGFYLGFQEADTVLTDFGDIVIPEEEEDYDSIDDTERIVELELLNELINTKKKQLEIIDRTLDFKEKLLEILDGTDYVQSLQDKYTKWLEEREKGNTDSSE